jgi:hypothetical protein
MNKNKYTGLLISILLILNFSSTSQTWPTFYGEPDRYDFSYDVEVGYDQSYYILGGYTNSSGFPKFTWLLKTDINGNILWDKIVKCDGFVDSFGLEPTHDGGLLISGFVILNSFGLNYLPFTVKINSCGEKEWCKVFADGVGELPSARDVKETPSGDIVILVNQFGVNPQETMHLFKLNSYGDLLWRKPYASGYVYPEAALPIGRKLMITTTGNYLIAAEAYWADPWNPTGPKPLRSLFVMVESNGDEKWVLPFGLQDSIHGQGKNILEINSNRFIGLANKWPVECMQTVLIEFDSLGIVSKYIILDNQQISPDISKGVPIKLQQSDSLYIIGGIYGYPNAGYSSEIILDTNIFSYPTVYNFYQHTGEEEPYSMSISLKKKILSNSTFKESGNWDIALSKLNLNLEYDTLDPGNYTYDSLCTTPGLPQSGFIFLDDCDIITGVDIPSPEAYYAGLRVIPITAFPNPAKDKVTFGIENTQYHKHITLRCFNLLGKQVFETAILTGQKEAATDVSRWPQGMYLAVVYSEGWPAGQCKFVVSN